jgi:hypothetical protein
VDTTEAVKWIFGVLAVMVAGGGLSWGGWVSVSLNRLSGQVAGMEAAILANDKTRDKLWTELIDRLERMENRLDQIQACVKQR